jgi:uncharacterized protein (DUF1810 family)
MPDPFNLERFVEAQGPIYDRVLSELSRGQKRSHWMWFIFPQIRGLGHSTNAKRFSILHEEEARAYLHHPILGLRLHECTMMVLKVRARSIVEIFDWPDDLKFRSSMTLFDFVAPGTVFGQALEKFFDGRGDPTTLAALDKTTSGQGM